MDWRQAIENAAGSTIAPDVQRARDQEAAEIKMREREQIQKSNLDAFEKQRQLEALDRDITRMGFTPPGSGWRQAFEAMPVPAAASAPAAVIPGVVPGQTAPAAVPEVSRLLSTARGMAKGVTAGASRPVSSFLMVGLDKLVGEGKLTRQEALSILDEQEAADVAANPVLYKGAEMAGAVGLGSRLAALRGGTTAKGMIGFGAGTGAVSGFSEKEQLEDALKGAGIGATLSLLPAGASKLINDRIARMGKEFTEKETKPIVQSVVDKVERNLPDMIKKMERKGKFTMSPEAIDQLRFDMQQKMIEQYTYGNYGRTVGEMFMKNVPSYLTPMGGVAGLGLSSIGGLSGAESAAVTAAGLLAKPALSTAANVVARNASVAAPQMQRAVSGTAQALTQPAIQSTTEYVTERENRLRKLADEFRLKYPTLVQGQ